MCQFVVAAHDDFPVFVMEIIRVFVVTELIPEVLLVVFFDDP